MSACRYYDRFAILARDQRMGPTIRSMSSNSKYPRRGKIKCAIRPVPEENKYRSQSVPHYGTTPIKKKPVIVVPETRGKPVVQNFY